MNAIPSVAASPESLEHQIREAAYYRWLDRGCPDGDDWSHWFEAEKHLRPHTEIIPLPRTELVLMPSRALSATQPAGNPGLLAGRAREHQDYRSNVAATAAPQRSRSHRPGGATREPTY